MSSGNTGPGELGSGGTALSSAEARILDVHLMAIRNEQRRQSDAMREISHSLAVLTRIEIENAHTKEQLRNGSMRMTEHEARIQNIEKSLPGLLEMRKWVIAGILAGVGMIGTAVFKMVIIDQPPPQHQQSGTKP